MWKILESYNQFKSDSVREIIEVWESGAITAYYITALNPRHSTPNKAHTVLVAVRYQVA